MEKPSISAKKKLLFFLSMCEFVCALLIGRVAYIQIVQAEEYQAMAYEQQTRDRLISPKRGSILDRNGVGIAETQSVTAVSVIHAQVKDEEATARFLSEKLDMEYDKVLEKVKKRVALERIKTKVDKSLAAEIRQANIPGVVVDEDVQRVYPFSNLAAQVIGFVGKDNQGIVGLEAKYDSYLKGESGKILTLTDARGLETGDGQDRISPVPGGTLQTSLDVVIQQYVEQTLSKVIAAKQAKRGVAIVMNPQNGEIYAMATKPDFDLNEPFQINQEALAAVWDTMSEKDKNDALNQMWRNTAINDTYEPGSTFKTITSSAGLEEGVVTPESSFVCNGAYTVAGRMIRCWRYPRSHGAETFVQGVQNSCNPVFMQVAERMGAEVFHDYMLRFGFAEKTGIDLPGEAIGIMHKKEDIGPVELATMSFGQSFQITPMQLLRAVSAIINGGNLVTPHLATRVLNEEGETTKEFLYEPGRQVISKATSDSMRTILESVVAKGSGNKAYIPGYRIGGKTATSEKLPRRSGKYISSFLAFAPADNPQVLTIILIDEPQGVYYGGTIVGPVMKELYTNVLPYLGIKPVYNEEEQTLEDVKETVVPDLAGLAIQEAKNQLQKIGLQCEIKGEGQVCAEQFPLPGEIVAGGAKILLYTQ